MHECLCVLQKRCLGPQRAHILLEGTKSPATVIPSSAPHKGTLGLAERDYGETSIHSLGQKEDSEEVEQVGFSWSLF